MHEIIVRQMISAVWFAGKYLLIAKPVRLDSPKDFLTNTDRASEEIVWRCLKEDCPEIPVWSEEGLGQALATGYQFVVDPLDGTVNYFHGDHHWGVSVGLVENGQSVAGAVYLPARCQMFFAVTGGPAQLITSGDYHDGQPKKVSVDSRAEAMKPLVLVEWVKEQNVGRDHERVIDILARLDRAGFLYPQIRNATTASLMMVAEGKASGFVHLRPEPFDIAAACLIVERAGGKVTDLFGDPWSPFSSERGIVASNGIIHDRLLTVVNN